MVSQDQQVADLQALLEVSRAMTAKQDLDDLLDLIMNETTRLLEAERSTLFLFDREKHELFSRIAQKSEIKEIRIPADKGIAGSVAMKREIINIEEAYEDERFNPEVDKETGFRTRSILCAPLLNNEQELIGVIQVLNKKDGHFTEYDERKIVALGSNAAVALENARLFKHYKEKQKIEQSLNIARQIQQDLLPDENPSHPSVEFHGYSNPAERTGGDYYDYFQLQDGNIGITLADVTGHGVGPAILMATVRSAFHALTQNTQDPGELLNQVNAFLYQDMGEDRFATACFFVIDPEAGDIRYANAGHNPPFLMQKHAEEMTEFPATGVPLGIAPGVEYTTKGPYTLNEEDLLVVYTDGLTETMNASEETFGRERLVNVIRDHYDHPVDQLAAVIEDKLQTYRYAPHQKDDMTMVLMRYLCD